MRLRPLAAARSASTFSYLRLGRAPAQAHALTFDESERGEVWHSATIPRVHPDPALVAASVTDLWPGAEWMEREVYDMLGIRFTDHPDMRRILLWETYPGHPLRKDYPVRGRGEREAYRIVDRHSS